MTTKLKLSEANDILIREMGNIQNCKLKSPDFTPFSDFMGVNQMHILYRAMGALLKQFKINRNETVYKLFTQNTGIIFPKFRELVALFHKRQKRGILVSLLGKFV